MGTALLIGILVCGFLNVTPWILAPATIVAAIIGMHFPSGKAQMARDRGIYWKALLSSFPLQFALMFVLFGIGWGASMLFG